MDSDDLDIVFHAMAHRDRRRILEVVRANPGCHVEEVSRRFATSRIAILKHLRVLETAGLIHSVKQGRIRKLYFNAVPIQLIYDRWTDELSAFWANEVAQIKYRVERSAIEAKTPRKRDA